MRSSFERPARPAGRTGHATGEAHSPPTHQRSVLWTGVYFLAVTAAVLAIATADAPPLLLLAAAAGILVAGYPIYRGLKRGRLEVFEPPVLLALLSFPILLRPIYWIAQTSLSVYPLDPREAQRAAVTAAAYVYLGQAVYYLVYYNARVSATLLRWFPTFQPNWPTSRVNKLLFVFIILGVVSYVAFMGQVGGVGVFLASLYRRRELSSGLGPLYMGILFLPVAAIIGLMAKRRLERLVLCLVALFAAGVLGTLGGRGLVITYLLTGLICWNYTVKRVAFSKIVAIAALSVLFAVVYGQLRSTTWEGRGVRVEVVTSREWSAGAILRAHFFDQNYLDTFAVLVADMPKQMPFQYGATYLRLFAAPVPRVLWPEKGDIFEGRTIGKVYFFGSGRPPGYAGVLYMNFHLPGIVLGCAFLAVFHRALYAYLRQNPANPGAVLFYATTVLGLSGFTNLAIVHWLMAIVPVFLAAKYLGAPVRVPAAGGLPRVGLAAR